MSVGSVRKRHQFGSRIRSIAAGTKRAPGPLYGIGSDVWAALAVALTWNDKHPWRATSTYAGHIARAIRAVDLGDDEARPAPALQRVE